MYAAKSERKGRQEKVDEIIRWLIAHGERELQTQLGQHTDFEDFNAQASCLNPSRLLIKGLT